MTVTVGSNTAEQVEEWHYEEVSNRPFPYTPITVMGTIEPVGFRAAHKWIEGWITVKSEAIGCFVQDTTANPAGVTMTIAVTKAGGNADTYTFTGTIFAGRSQTGRHDEEATATYKFVAKSVTK